MVSPATIYRLGVKELWSLWRDPIMLVLIVYAFTLAIYMAGTAVPDTVSRAALAIVDEDDSPLSTRIVAVFYPPHFLRPVMIGLDEVDPGMDSGRHTFVLDIPPGFQRDVLAGRAPALQLSVDATRMSQAFSGSGSIQQIALAEVDEFVRGVRGSDAPPVDLVLRARFNPNLTQAWFGSLMELISMVTMLAMREHGIKVDQTKVGDRYVLESMNANGFALGGEQSGHVIISEFANTGDGTLTGLHLASRMKATGKTLKELGSVMTELPQVVINVRGVDKLRAGIDTGVQAEVSAAARELGDTGRVLLRPSGTEPVVRVMCEAPTIEQAQEIADRLAAKVKERLTL